MEATANAAGGAVYQAITRVQEELAKTGIGKDRKNKEQGYSFRGIDDVYNEIAPLLAKHRLCILPRVLSREVVERTSKNGTALFSVTVECEFDFVSAEDGSRHTVRIFGEAMDSADKATNKAMSAAYKYAALQAFCIPTEGDNDADAATHEVTPRQPPQATAGKAPEAAGDKSTEYQERIRTALRAIFRDDKAAALAYVEKQTTWTDKATGEVKAAGVKDYRKLNGKRLEIFCHTVERDAKKTEPQQATVADSPQESCSACNGPLVSGECYNADCPQGIPF